MAASSEPDGLFTPAALANPYPIYRRLRETDPVYWHEPSAAWMLLRYDDVAAALQDRRLASARIGGMRATAYHEELKATFDLIGDQLNLNDPPRHNRLRALVSYAFTPHAVQGMQSTIQQLVDGLLDKVQARGEMDVIADFAFPLPATVIATMLGLPVDDLPSLRRWSDDYAALFGGSPSAITREQASRAQQSTSELWEYFCRILHQRRANPADDLISRLASAEIDGNRLTESEIVANANVLLGAGHETTTHLIGNGLLALFRHPDALNRLRSQPALIATAVDEFLRFDAPVQFMNRQATQDLELGGKQIKQGQFVFTMFGAANHDPQHFPQPDQFDISRVTHRHLAFGLGEHYCVGAPLARLEAQIAFTTLLRRFPSLRLQEETLEYQSNFEIRGLKRLPVAFHS